MFKQLTRQSTVRLILLTTAIGFGLPSAEIEASRAMPRTVTASENISLAIPRDLDEVTENGKMGIDFESKSGREAASVAIDRYVKYRRAPGKNKSFEKECEQLGPEASAAIPDWLCKYESDRRRRASESSESPRRSRSQRREVADQLRSENWEAVTDIPYQSVVGIVGSIDTKADLLAMGKTLGDKSQCVGSKAATAIAYKLEEHFPDAEAVTVASKLYAYAANCSVDFAAAKAAYRLALLEVWQNRCDGVPKLMSQVELNKEATQFHSRAKYWKAYCAEVLGQKDISRESRKALMFEYPMTFHNLAANASDATSIDWVVRDGTPAIAFRSLVRSDLNPVIRSIEVLIKNGASDLAAEMTDRSLATIQQLEPEVRLYIAGLMHRQNHALPKFKILGQLFQDSPRTVSGATMRLYFPLWFFETIKPAAAEIDPYLVTALIRQESAFNTHARSRVGARGLMQLMPATARMISSVRTSRLFDAKTNISIGTSYFRKRLAQYNGDVELTLAAYNAGFAKVDEWRRRYPTENRILFLDLIPYRETRDYVATILRNYYWYTKLYAGVLPTAAKVQTDDGRTVASTPEGGGAGAQDINPLSATFHAIMRAESGLTVHSHVAPLPTGP